MSLERLKSGENSYFVANSYSNRFNVKLLGNLKKTNTHREILYYLSNQLLNAGMPEPDVYSTIRSTTGTTPGRNDRQHRQNPAT